MQAVRDDKTRRSLGRIKVIMVASNIVGRSKNRRGSSR